MLTRNTLPNTAGSATRSALSPMTPGRPRWLDVFRHRIRGVRVPFALVVRQHAIAATTRLVAPVSLSLPNDVDVEAYGTGEPGRGES
jgi:hypothetical protein